MRSMSRICDALGSCFFCVSELCLVASVRRWVPARTQARVYALARGVRKWSHGSWHITASPPRCCMVSMRVRFQDTESCEALKGAAGRRVHGVLERRKVKPGARSIQVTPLIAKKGDGWLGSKAHGFLHALKESDTVLSLLIVTDMVAAWRYRQLVFLLKRWGMKFAFSTHVFESARPTTLPNAVMRPRFRTLALESTQWVRLPLPHCSASP
mgnify:CR=1 FL=1